MTQHPSQQSQLNQPQEIYELLEVWPALPHEERSSSFAELDHAQKEDLFLRLEPPMQLELLREISKEERKLWLRLLAPDDTADLIQASEAYEEKEELLNLVSRPMRLDVKALLAYKEDVAGGLMSPRFARLRPGMNVEEAIRYLRAQTKMSVETIYYAYVLDSSQKLLGLISLRRLFSSDGTNKVDDIMIPLPELTVVRDDLDQEEIGRIFSQQDFVALPVVDPEGRMKGIITADDIVDVIKEEATEDIQKIGGMEALDAPYFQVTLPRMLTKRAGWLLILFVGEMFTATAMAFYEHEIAKAVVLALFIPLIISSGGNSGSQATTLIIRAMALGEVRLKDWWRVLFRETVTGLTMGLVLASVGFFRIIMWPNRVEVYGKHFFIVAVTVACSLVGVVLWGTLVGAMLPFLFRLLRLDPATSSAPFVATLVDVTGLVIYFTLASFIMHGTLL